MTPSQYEHAVASYFRAQGYDAQVTPYNNDFGVDLFATKGPNKIAVQAKMYGGSARAVNRETVLILQGAKDYFECQSAVLVTDGRVTESARKVAGKLRIEILNFSGEQIAVATGIWDDEVPKSRFDLIWEEHVMPLAGRTISNSRGLTNTILKVDWGGVERVTENAKPNRLSIEAFRRTVVHLLREGSVTRKVINEEYVSRGSSGVMLILSQVPLFEYRKHPIQQLQLKRQPE